MKTAAKAGKEIIITIKAITEIMRKNIGNKHKNRRNQP